MSQYYDSNHLLLVLGADVNFEKAEYHYQEFERMMKQFNSMNSDIELSFSTLRQYGQQVGKLNRELTSYYYDMMPYSDDDRRYFTGLFSSQPNLKAAIREAS